ncbi:MAG: hypothetical protein H6563_13470 [Lewinellaceae bacterium]|nr:hypothetical protein [Lewinellaceae bacterium]
MTKAEREMVKTLLEKDEIKKALDLMKQFCPNNLKVSQFLSRFNDLENHFYNETYSEDRYTSKKNKLRKSIFNFLVQGDSTPSDLKTDVPVLLSPNEDILKKENNMYHTIGNNLGKGDSRRLSETNIEFVREHIHVTRMEIASLPVDHHFLPKIIKSLGDLELSFNSLLNQIRQSDNEGTSLEVQLKTCLQKTKEVLKEISQARRNRSASEANEYIRNFILPYYDHSLDKLVKIINTSSSSSFNSNINPN